MQSNSNQVSMGKLFLIIICAFILGATGMYFYKKSSGDKSDSYSFTKEQDIQERFRKQQNKPDGGAQATTQSQDFSTRYYNYLKLKEPDPTEFDKKYVAGAYYTISELENYFSVIKSSNPLIKAKDIRVYLCPSLYPDGTINPINGENVGNKLSACLVFMKTPYNLTVNRQPYIYGNINCLGAYNWGDLEP